MNVRPALWITLLACASAGSTHALRLFAAPHRRAAPSSRGAQSPRPAALSLPGACVPIPERTYVLHRSRTQSSPPDPAYPFTHDDDVSMSTWRAFDLDRDGTDDAIVPEPEPGDCVDTYHWAIYVVRGTCGHRVGLVHGSIYVDALRTASRASGLPDVVTRTDQQHQRDPRRPAEHTVDTFTYHFDGHEYREASHTTRTEECYHCPAQVCRNTLVP